MACPGVSHVSVLATRLGTGTARQVSPRLPRLSTPGHHWLILTNTRVYSALATSAAIETTPTVMASPSKVKEDVSGGKGKPFKIAKPFEDIPGPKPWPIIGNKLLFTPLGGYSMEHALQTHKRMHAEYGPIVRISGLLPGRGMIYLYTPEDIKTLFQIEGNYPIRPPMDILAFYRENRPQYYPSPGLVTSNGPEWHRLRVCVHKLMRPDMVNQYKMRLAVVAQDLVHLFKCQTLPQDNGQAIVIKDILPLLMQYTLEGVGVVSVGTRIGCLEVEGAPTEATEIIEANYMTLKTLGDSYYLPPIYRLIPTKHYRNLAASQDIMVKVVQAELKQRYHEREIDPTSFSSSEPFLEYLMANEAISKKDVLLLVTEILQGGIDATATTIGFCLYFISRHPEIQQKLWEELKDVDPMHHNLQGLPYLRAIIKETYRLRSPATAAARIIQEDAVISGYHVPKGTYVLGVPSVPSKCGASFPFPDSFIPERWMSKSRKSSDKNSEDSDQTNCLVNLTGDAETEALSAITIAAISSASNPYSIIPFSHGARMCPGRRLAEQEIYLAIIAIVRAFRLEWIGASEVGQVQKLNLMPDNTFDIKFTLR